MGFGREGGSVREGMEGAVRMWEMGWGCEWGGVRGGRDLEGASGSWGKDGDCGGGMEVGLWWRES